MKKLASVFLIFLSLLATTSFAQVQVTKKTFQRFKAVGINSPQLAQNTVTGEFLAVWLQSDGSGGHLVGRITNKTGKTITPAMTFADDYWIFDLALAYNPIRNEYLLVYDDRPTDPGPRVILGIRLDPAGKSIGNAINISKSIDTFRSNNWNPRVIFNPKTGGYSVVWEHNENGFQLVGVSVSDAGKVGRAVVIRKATGDFPSHSALGCVPMDIAYHQPSGKLLVTYFRVRPDHAEDYFLATLDALLKKVPASASSKINKEPIHDDYIAGYGLESASIALHDNTGVIYFNDNTSVKQRAISLQGRPAGQITQAFNAPVNQTEFAYQKALFSAGPGGTSGILVAIPSDYGSVWAQPLDSNGAPVGTPTKLYTASISSFALGQLPATAATHSYLWLGTVNSNGRNGIVKLKLGVSD